MSSLPSVYVRFDQSGLRAGREVVREFTAELLGRELRDLGWSVGEMTVLYCSPKAMCELNREHLGIDEVTDVLSFPFSDEPAKLANMTMPYLGDLAISLHVCAAQAPEHGHATGDELALLLTHGLLHLLGHDHDTPAKKDKMWRVTDKLLALTRSVPRPAITVKPHPVHHG